MRTGELCGLAVGARAEQGLLGRLGHQGGVKGGVGLFLPSPAVSPGHLARPRGALAGPEQVPCEPRGASADGVRCGPSFSPESITQNRLPQRGCLLVTTCASRTLVQGSVSHSLSTSGVPKQLSVGAPSFPSLSDRRGMGAQRGEAACPRSRGHAAGKGRDWGLGPGCPARPSPQSPGIGQLGQPAFSPEASGTHPPGAVHRTPHPGNPHAQGGECWVSPRSRPLFWGS